MSDTAIQTIIFPPRQEVFLRLPAFAPEEEPLLTGEIESTFSVDLTIRYSAPVDPNSEEKPQIIGFSLKGPYGAILPIVKDNLTEKDEALIMGDIANALEKQRREYRRHALDEALCVGGSY